MHILLTRPQRQGEQTAAILRARGHRVTHVPLLKIELNRDIDVRGDFAAIAITSANAVEGVKQHPAKDTILRLPTFAVGERTAAAARAAGFSHVTSVDGDVARLAEVLRAQVPASSAVLYLAGEDRAGDLAAMLGPAGFSVRTVEVYRAVAAQTLPPEIDRVFETGPVDAVLHYSRRSVETLLGLAGAGSCLVNILKCKHFCISAQVAEPLISAGAGSVIVAQRPDEAALLMLVGTTTSPHYGGKAGAGEGTDRGRDG